MTHPSEKAPMTREQALSLMELEPGGDARVHLGRNRPAVEASGRLTDEQWYDLASRHANGDWNSDKPDGYLLAVKAVCSDFAALAASAPAAPSEPHLSICASLDDTMAGHPACDCGAAPAAVPQAESEGVWRSIGTSPWPECIRRR